VESLIKIKKEIAVGIFLVLVLAIVLALGFEIIDRPSVMCVRLSNLYPLDSAFFNIWITSLTKINTV